MDSLVSVLMCVHNEPIEYLKVALDSIINQSYSNLEIIIVDDASEPYVTEYLNSIIEKYIFIKVIRNRENYGLTKSLNIGLTLTTGKYIARMDSDDYSCPERIAKQVEFLEANREIDILGTGVVSFGECKSFLSPYKGASSSDIRNNLFFTSCLCHPSVMIRKSFLDKTGLTYDETVKKGQDYDLWERASVYGNLLVIPEVLLFYRIHSGQITNTNKGDQESSADIIMRRRLKRIDVNPTEEEMKCHYSLKGIRNNMSVSDIEKWVNKLKKHSEDSELIESHSFAKELDRRFAFYKLKNHCLISFKEIPLIIDIIKDRISMKRKLSAINTPEL